MANKPMRMQIEIIRNHLIHEYKITLYNGCYYDVWTDGDTDRVALYDPEDNHIVNLVVPFGGYKYQVDCIYDLIVEDAYRRGYGINYLIDVPNMLV